MNILILSCDTGGGHNTTGLAILEELQRRGHHVIMKDPFSLSHGFFARNVGTAYVKLVQKNPKAFGLLYHLGMLVTKLHFKSPIYYINGLMSRHMTDFLNQNPFDVIVMPHLYPAEILTYMKNKNQTCPKSVFIATDYACIPFTEETSCDRYIIPHKTLAKEFIKRGIPAEKIKALGIPVRSAFTSNITKADARKQLGLSDTGTYFLVAGGSVGAGKLKQLVDYLVTRLKLQEHIIVICGNNKSLYRSLNKKYGHNSDVTILGATDRMAAYMQSCDILFSKPGGLSSTEAAVTGIPLIHISPIPGCESRNKAFFRKRGMSVSARQVWQQAELGIRLLENKKARDTMILNQRKNTSGYAAKHICDMIERL